MRNRLRVQNKLTAARSRNLGNLGEQWAAALLERNGFTNVENFNNRRKNHAYADIYAERNGERYVISVKTRNKLKVGGDLNDSYNLSSSGNHYKLSEAAKNAWQAKAAWVAICVEEAVFSAYFGLLDDLNRKNTIPMTEVAISSYQCLAKNESHGLDYSKIKNIYDDVVPASQEVNVFAVAYPIVVAWIRSGGWIEVGTDYNVQSFIRALDEGGIIWEGAAQYSTVDAAFKALDAGIAVFIKEHGIKL